MARPCPLNHATPLTPPCVCVCPAFLLPFVHRQVIIYKMKAKKHYRRTNGHRQPLSKILVTKIAAAQ